MLPLKNSEMTGRGTTRCSLLFTILLSLFVAAESLAQTSAGTVVLRLVEQQPIIEHTVRIQLVERNTESVVQEQNGDPSTEIVLRNVPFGSYTVVVSADSLVLAETQIEVRVYRLTSCDDMVSLSDVGFGVSQVLPVLVALRAADQRNLVYIEEPEIHLHPRAQVKLGDILARAAQDGARVIAETHSTLLLTAIQTLVAKGELASNLVKFHSFERDPKAGVTRVSSTGLDSNGAFTESDWPEDFDDIILNAEGAYLDAVEGRQVR